MNYNDLILLDDDFFVEIEFNLPVLAEGFQIVIIGEEAPPADETNIQTWG